LINKNLSALTKGILDDDPDRQKQQVSLIHFFKTLYFQNIEKLKFGITAVRPFESFYCFNLSSLYYPP